jgi:hypothetical protein
MTGDVGVGSRKTDVVLVIIGGFVLAALWVGVVGLGVTMVWRGLRGRFGDRRPRCIACGYVLVGAARLPPRCSECGTEISGPRAYRLGPRERRWSLVMMGALTMLLCATPLALLYRPAAVKRRAPAAAKPVVPPVAAVTPRPRRIRPVPAPMTLPPIAPPPDRAEDDAAIDADVTETITAGMVDPPAEPSPYRELRTVAGCCPYCGHPVVSPNVETRCPGCGEDLDAG